MTIPHFLVVLSISVLQLKLMDSRLVNSEYNVCPPRRFLIVAIVINWVANLQMRNVNMR